VALVGGLVDETVLAQAAGLRLHLPSRWRP
jgi:hypothetical protein